MIRVLKIVFATILFLMLLIVITAGLNQNMLEAVRQIWPNWWFKVTLLDAYCGFLTIFVWVAYKERLMWRKLVWFAAFMLLGNVAISSYVLLELAKLRESEPFDTLLTRRNG